MRSVRSTFNRGVMQILLLCLAICSLRCVAVAQTSNTNYIILVGSGFLCEPGDTSMCPAVVKANAGDSYEMTGAGTFDAQSKSVKAAGTFTHKSPNGNVLETGVWLANELISFDSYGVAPNALLHQNMLLGPASMNPKRLAMARGPMPTGGLAVFRIMLVPISGPPSTAVLQVNCALGDVPRERAVEGIRLKLDTSDAKYEEELSGRVMFLSLSMQPEVSMPAKVSREETTPETPEQPQN